MSGPAIVTVTRAIAASPERAFDAWIEPDQAKQFLFKMRQGEIVHSSMPVSAAGSSSWIAARPATRSIMVSSLRSTGRDVSFSCFGAGSEEGDWSKMTVEITPSSSGLVITLTHKIPSEWASYAQPVRNGWTTILDTLAVEMEKKNG